MQARITTFKMRPDAAGEARALMERLKDEIMGQPGIRHCLIVMNSDGSGHVLTLTYQGSTAVRPARTQLLAARRAASLKVKRVRLRAGKLRAAGTLARKARGSVQLTLEWEDAAGTAHNWHGHAKSRRGRWKLSAKLPAAARGGGSLTIRYGGDRKRNAEDEHVEDR